MEIARLRERLERDHWPRLQMSLIVLLTGAVGFLASFALLHAGLHDMALRYPLAACAAYAAFLLLLWTWARSRGREFDSLDAPDFGGSGDGSGSCPADWQTGGHNGSGASSNFDAPASPSLPLPRTQTQPQPSTDSDFSLLDGADDFGWVLIAIAAAVGAALAALWVVWIAPGLMAELLLDVALAGGLYRRLRRIESQHWLSTALRRTAVPFLVVALLAFVAGFAGARYAPGAQSIGDVIAAQRAAHD